MCQRIWFVSTHININIYIKKGLNTHGAPVSTIRYSTYSSNPPNALALFLCAVVAIMVFQSQSRLRRRAGRWRGARVASWIGPVWCQLLSARFDILFRRGLCCLRSRVAVSVSLLFLVVVCMVWYGMWRRKVDWAADSTTLSYRNASIITLAYLNL